MIPWLAQSHTVAQIDSDSIVNFLILVIMAALWLFATLIKAAGKRKPPQGGPAGQQRESWQQRLARKAEELQRAMEGHTDEGTERMRERLEERARQRARAQESASGKITVRTGRGGESVMVYEKAEPQPGISREQHAARQQEAKEAVAAAGRKAVLAPIASAAPETTSVALGPAQEIQPREVTIGARQEPAAGYDPASIIDVADPDALRKAILHYEILGKPIGLRDPSEQSTIF